MRDDRYSSALRLQTRSLTPIRTLTRSGFSSLTWPSSFWMRSSVVYPLTAGLKSSTWRPVSFSSRLATIAGQPCDESDPPVPIVYQSPSARYRMTAFTPLFHYSPRAGVGGYLPTSGNAVQTRILLPTQLITPSVQTV